MEQIIYIFLFIAVAVYLYSSREGFSGNNGALMQLEARDIQDTYEIAGLKPNEIIGYDHSIYPGVPYSPLGWE